MSARNEKLEKFTQEQEDEIKKLRKSISYRLGKTLKDSAKSPKSLIKLPYRLYKLVQEGREKQKQKKHAKSKKSHESPVKKQHVYKPRDPDFLTLKTNQALSKIKVAAIMDEFTYNSFKYECELIQLTPTDWKEEMEANRPDFVFVESAWQGKERLWQTKVSNASKELVAMLEWCSKQKIPTLFWNKEDPVHFDTFIETASLVDFVFTTDIDCVAKYKNVLGHNRVNFLPFAAQPFVHNPIEVYERKDAFNFAGSYYLRYPERQRDFKSLVAAVKAFKPVEIFDRNYDNPHPHYTFPDEYKPMILG
ncbi:MAG: methyltransferase type 12, partial [Epsilonproteobacteria bacterium]|nr:methyltransferase type 12 [Campylobacterota bacterium]